MLPLDYAIRNLLRSPSRLLMSITGTMLMVFLVLAAAAFIQGMNSSLISSGSTTNVMLVGTGSEESIERSEISPTTASQFAASVSSIRNSAGVDFVSPEVHSELGVAFSADDPADSQAVFRGVTPAGYLVHPQVRIVEGRAFTAGEDEIIVGELTATRLDVPEETLAIGNSLWVDGHELRIVGHFAAPNTVMNAEIWYGLTNLQLLTQRDGISCVVATMQSTDFSEVEAFAATRLDLELAVIAESDYYSQLQAFFKPLRLMIWATAGLIALGAILGGLNVMYAAFAARTREVGMLQCLGYGKSAVIISFVQESLLAAGIGTLLGAAAAVLLFPDVAVKFSMGAFGLVIDESVLAYGLAAGLLLGIAGAIPPAIHCLRLPITDALKSV
jgi:putative ABC transport system permease protein